MEIVAMILLSYTEKQLYYVGTLCPLDQLLLQKYYPSPALIDSIQPINYKWF